MDESESLNEPYPPDPDDSPDLGQCRWCKGWNEKKPPTEAVAVMTYRKAFMAAVCKPCVENGTRAGWTMITDPAQIEQWIEAGQPYDTSGSVLAGQ